MWQFAWLNGDHCSFDVDYKFICHLHLYGLLYSYSMSLGIHWIENVPVRCLFGLSAIASSYILRLLWKNDDPQAIENIRFRLFGRFNPGWKRTCSCSRHIIVATIRHRRSSLNFLLSHTHRRRTQTDALKAVQIQVCSVCVCACIFHEGILLLRL